MWKTKRSEAMQQIMSQQKKTRSAMFADLVVFAQELRRGTKKRKELALLHTMFCFLCEILARTIKRGQYIFTMTPFDFILNSFEHTKLRDL